MASQTFSLIMHITSEASMSPFQLLSAPPLSSLSRFQSYMLCRDCLLLLLNWFYHSFQLDHLNVWKRKGMQQLHLHWHGYYPIYPYQGVDQLVQLSMTSMLCRLVLVILPNFKGVVFLALFVCIFWFTLMNLLFRFSSFTRLLQVSLNEKR